MLTLVLPMLFQAAAGAPAVQQNGAAAAEPPVVCKMVPVTGSRARKQKVCKTKDYEKEAERDREGIRRMMNMPGAPAPGAPG